MPSQSTFEESHDHFTLTMRSVRRQPKRKSRNLSGNRIPLPRGSKKSFVHERALYVRDKSLNMQKLYNDNRIYFVIKFTLPLNNSFVRKTLSKLNGDVTFFYSDGHTVKIAIPREKYEVFSKGLEEGRKFIADITESYKEQKVVASLGKLLKENPDANQHVIISAIDLSGIKLIDSLELSLTDYIEKNGGSVNPSYKSEKMAIFHANTSSKILHDLVEKIDIIEKIETPPEISLTYKDVQMPMGVGREVIPLAENEPGSLPVVCLLDSGINKDHQILRDYIVDTFDFSSSSQSPCNDEYGHGSLVAGTAIYCGSYGTNISPRARVIMSKIFDAGGKPINVDVLRLVNETIFKFQGQTRIFNLSFSSLVPSYSFNIGLDQLVYDRGIVVVTSAGNITDANIIQELNDDHPYPSYLENYHIFSPGDSANTITVGSISHMNTNICAKHYPSPFTRSGIGNNNIIKPDLVYEGGNYSMIERDGKVIELSPKGIMSATPFNNNTLTPVLGTSFSSPPIASILGSILQRYPNSSPFLLKAILLSSYSELEDSQRKSIPHLVQGFGIPDVSLATNSIRWRTLYLMEGRFLNSSDQFHRYQFLFPDNANRLVLTLAVGRPAFSNSSITYELEKPGTKKSSKQYPNKKGTVGVKKKIVSAFKGLYNVKYGGKGVWKLNIFPLFDTNLDTEIRYACVICVESTKYQDVYSQISRWIRSTKMKQVPQIESVPLKHHETMSSSS